MKKIWTNLDIPIIEALLGFPLILQGVFCNYNPKLEMSKHIFLYAMKKADKREKIQEFKDELDERADVLNGVMKQIKEDKDTDSEKKEELLKKIKKNRKVMEKVSTILGKNPRKQDE